MNSLAIPKPRKPKKEKLTGTPAGKRHMEAVKRLNCLACMMESGLPNSPCIAHHLTGRPRNDFETIPSCLAHHVKTNRKISIHGNKSEFYITFGQPDTLLLKTYGELIAAKVELEPQARKVYEELIG